MTEGQVKEICKFLIEHGNRPIIDLQKELLKHAVDEATTWDQLMLVAAAYANTRR